VQNYLIAVSCPGVLIWVAGGLYLGGDATDGTSLYSTWSGAREGYFFDVILSYLCLIKGGLR
jgi:hypothetical protein